MSLDDDLRRAERDLVLGAGDTERRLLELWWRAGKFGPHPLLDPRDLKRRGPRIGDGWVIDLRHDSTSPGFGRPSTFITTRGERGFCMPLGNLVAPVRARFCVDWIRHERWRTGDIHWTSWIGCRTRSGDHVSATLAFGNARVQLERYALPGETETIAVPLEVTDEQAFAERISQEGYVQEAAPPGVCAECRDPACDAHCAECCDGDHQCEYCFRTCCDGQCHTRAAVGL